MKQLILTLMLAMMIFPAIAEESASATEGWLKSVDAEYVCMVNDTKFDTSQISVEVEGKTYYGCCPMCKDRLANDASIRVAVDPVSGNSVDKSKAVIGVGLSREVYYFESKENLQKFSHGGMPEAEHSNVETKKHSCEHIGSEGESLCEGHTDHGSHEHSED